MTRKLFLFGGFTDNFAELIKPFVLASGNKNAKIVVLQQGSPGWEKYIDPYKSPFKALGVKSINIIVPENNTRTLSESNIKLIKNATGIFIGGGDTSIYKEIYCESELGEIIKEKYNSGIPYAGLSAGAILVAEKFFSNEYGSDVHKGYGFLKKTLIEPHFIERNGFSKLLTQYENIDYTKGIGINEDVCLEVIDESKCIVHGNSEVYYITKTDEGFELIRYGSGFEFEI